MPTEEEKLDALLARLRGPDAKKAPAAEPEVQGPPAPNNLPSFAKVDDYGRAIPGADYTIPPEVRVPGLLDSGESKPEPSIPDRLRQGTSDTATGLLGGLYQLGAVPQNLIAAATGAEWLRASPEKALDAVGLPPPGTSLQSKITQNLAAVPTMVVGGGLLSKAASPVTQGVGRTLQANVPAQLAASTGAGAVQSVLPDNPYAQFFGGLLGGVGGGGIYGAIQAGKAALGSTAARDWQAGLRKYVGLASDKARVVEEGLGLGLPPAEPPPGPPTEAQQAAAGRTLKPVQLGDDGKPATPGDAAAAMQNLRTTGELLDDPGLLRAEATARNASGLRDEYAQRDAQRRDAQGHVLDTIVPAGSTDPAAIRAPIAAAADQAQGNLATARGELGPASSGATTGPALQDVFTAQRGASRGRVGGLADAVDPNNEVTMPTAGVRTAVRDSVERNLPNVTPDGYPAPIADIMTALSSRELTYQQFRDLKQTASEAAKTADPRTGRVLTDIIGSLEAGQPGFIDQHIANSLPPDALARQNAYLAAAKTQGDRFAGPIAKDLDARDYGRPGEDLQSTIASKFLRPDSQGGSDTMGAFGRYFRDPQTGRIDPQAADAMRRHVADQINGLTLNGEVNPKAHAAWLADHTDALRAVPELGLYDRVRNVSEATRLAGEAGTPGVGPVDPGTYQGNVARTILRADTMTGAVQKILADPQSSAGAMRDAVSRLDKPGVEALKREVLDQLGRAGQTDTPSFTGEPNLRQSGSTRWWNRNQNALSVLFDPDELARIKTVHDNIWSQARVRDRMALSGSDTQPKLSNAQALASNIFGEGDPTLGREIIGQVFGKIPYAGSVWKGVQESASARAMGKLYDLARDPELFATMLRRADPQTLGELAGTTKPLPGLRVARDALGRGAAAAGRAALPGLTIGMP